MRRSVLMSEARPEQSGGLQTQLSTEEGVALQLLTLIGASLFAPLMVWVNSAEHGGISGVLPLAALVLLLALGAWSLAIWLGFSRQGTTYAVALFVFGATNAGTLLDRGVSRLLLLVVLAFASLLGYRLRNNHIFRMAALWGAIVVLGYPWLAWMTSSAETGLVTIQDPPPLEAALVGEPRDILVLVLDGYANGVVLDELYGYDIHPFAEELAALGFDVTTTAATNYGRTRFSVASVMQLSYPVREGALTGADLDHLLEIIGGDNALSMWLTSRGYHHTYVESGWFGTVCRTSVDTCIPGPWPNESIYDFTNRTILKDLPGLETGRSFSNGAQNTMQWLELDLEPLLRNDRADLIYAHVLAPHPPLFLNSECQMRAQEGFKGFTIAHPGMTDQELKEARLWYGRQVDCVNGVLMTVAEVVAENGADALILGDHGPDSLGQLFLPGAEWSPQQRRERLGAFVAARVGGCNMNDISSLVNLGRRMVSCISDADLPDLGTFTYESEQTADGERLVRIATPNYQDS